MWKAILLYIPLSSLRDLAIVTIILSNYVFWKLEYVGGNLVYPLHIPNLGTVKGMDSAFSILILKSGCLLHFCFVGYLTPTQVKLYFYYQEKYNGQA